MMARIHLATATALVTLLVGLPAWAELGLRETLQSAVTEHPLVQVARAKKDEAQGKVVEARGAFDLRAWARGQWAPVGTYSKSYGKIGLEQPTTLWGTKVSASYENGADFQLYDGDRVTSELGVAALEVLVPLLRDGPIDERRTAQYRSELAQKQAEQEARLIRTQLMAQAASTWWKWAVLGKKREVYRALLELASDRRGLLREQVAMGAVAAMEVTDNHRLVASRQAAVAHQNLELSRLALKLGLYVRNGKGEPMPPKQKALPEQLPPTRKPGPSILETALKDAKKAPQAQLTRLTLDVLDRELRLARNETLPRVDFRLKTTQGMGPERSYAPFADSLSETKVMGSLDFELDVQRRKARGKVAQLQAKRAMAEGQLQLTVDSMHAEIRAAFAALRWGHQQVLFNREATDAAEELAVAEREKFSLGQSSILNVNLREQAVLSARLAELEALLEYQLAWIDLQAMLGRDDITDYASSAPPSVP